MEFVFSFACHTVICHLCSACHIIEKDLCIVVQVSRVLGNSIFSSLPLVSERCSYNIRYDFTTVCHRILNWYIYITNPVCIAVIMVVDFDKCLQWIEQSYQSNHTPNPVQGYIDDVSLFCNNITSLEEMTKKTTTFMNQCYMEVNTRKCALLCSYISGNNCFLHVLLSHFNSA